MPGEIELGRRYRASRTVVREALKLLSAKGLIASRKRSGTRARPREAWNMLDADVLAWRLRDGQAEPKFVSDLLHVRAVVEPAAAAMAARSHTKKSLEPIEEAFAEMERTAHDRVAFADPDRRFHKAILVATGNDFMVAFAALTGTALGAFVRIASRHPGAPATVGAVAPRRARGDPPARCRGCACGDDGAARPHGPQCRAQRPAAGPAETTLKARAQPWSTLNPAFCRSWIASACACFMASAAPCCLVATRSIALLILSPTWGNTGTVRYFM